MNAVGRLTATKGDEKMKGVPKLVFDVAKMAVLTLALVFGCAAAIAHGGGGGGGGGGGHGGGGGGHGGGWGGHGGGGGFGGGGRGGGFGHFGGGGGYGRYHYGYGFGGWGIGFADPFWDSYLWLDDGYDYDYPYGYGAAAVAVPPEANTNLPPAASYWYYCPDSKTYYPYVRQCASTWTRVPTSPAP